MCMLMLSWFSRVWLFVAPWTVGCQAPLSMGFSRWEYWSGLPRPSSGDLPDPGIKPTSLMSRQLAGGFFTTSTPGEPNYQVSNKGIQGFSSSKESTCNAGDAGSIPGLGRSPGEGNGNWLQYACLGNIMDRGTWMATVHGLSSLSA